MVAPPWLPVPPTGYGGTELVIDGLCRGLIALGHEVTLFTTGDSTCPVPMRFQHPQALGTGRSNTAGMLNHVLRAYDIADALEPDIVHDHTILGAYVASTRHHPAITTNHNPFDSDTNPIYSRLAAAVPVIAISNAHAATAHGFTPITAIHHGIDTEAMPLGDGSGGYALSLGRISPSKGIHLAIDAARAAGIPLRIAAKVTEQGEREYFHREIEPRLGDGIEFLGEVGGAVKVQLLREAACLLNPIQWDEPFGMVMVEAMACGTPVIATDRGAAAELVRDGVNGVLVSSRTEPSNALVDSIAEAIRRALAFDRHKVRADAIDRFSLTRMARDHVVVYEHVLASAHR